MKVGITNWTLTVIVNFETQEQSVGNILSPQLNRENSNKLLNILMTVYIVSYFLTEFFGAEERITKGGRLV